MSQVLAPTNGKGLVVRLLSDRALADRAAAGGTEAFGEVFRRFHQEIYRYCFSILGNEHDAMDALQGTMTKALGSIPGDDREVKLKPWLYRVAHNECIDLIRARRPGADVTDVDPECSTQVEIEVAARERLRHLLDDIDHLPERQRSALVMRELSGLGFDEIASALGTSASVSRQTVYEARLALQDLEQGRSMPCENARRAVSSGDGRVMRGRALKAHLRSCADCRDFGRGIEDRERQLQSVVPYLPVAAAASILGGVSSGGGGLAVVGGGGAAAISGVGVGTKAVVILAVTVGIGAGAAGLVSERNSGQSAEQEAASSIAADGSSPAGGDTARPHDRRGKADSALKDRGDGRGQSREKSEDGSGGSGEGASSVSPGATGGGTVGDGNTVPVGVEATDELPSAGELPVKAPKPKLPVNAPVRPPADLPEAVEGVRDTVGQVQETVDGVQGKVEKAVPPDVTGGLLGR